MKMASPSAIFTVKMVEETQIYPSPTTASNDNNLPQNLSLIPLTMFDIPWLLLPPSQPLFFFQLPHNVSCDFFSTDVLPKLKLSLSSALHYFFPFAAELTSDDDQNLFFSSSSSSSSVLLTVAECIDNDNDNDEDDDVVSNFDWLCSYSPRDAAAFHKLVPHLQTPLVPNTTNQNFKKSPLLAIQITYFPNNNKPAFSIGLAYHHVLCDQRTFHHFVRSWASLSKFGAFPLGLRPIYDRSPILDNTDDGLIKPIMLEQWRDWESAKPPASNDFEGMINVVRATFVMSPTDIANAKQWMLAQCDETNRAYPVLLSPYVVTCAFVWACLVKVQQEVVGRIDKEGSGSNIMYFGFIAGGITRLSYPVPVNYFGNCVAFGRAAAKREELEDYYGIGMLAAADAIGQTVRHLDGDVVGGAANWIPDWAPIIGSDKHMNVVGSPKVELYKTDFGWGVPKKIEEISIDGMRGICVSLMESRDMKAGIEIGLTLPNSQIHAFTSLFAQGLTSFHCV